MRALRCCDFCGADAVGTFEIVPPELEPSEDEQRRVVLCPDCRDRLEALLEPLLVRAGATRGRDDAEGASAGDGESDSPKTTVVSANEPSTRRSPSHGRTSSDGETDSDSRTGITLGRDDEADGNDSDADEPEEGDGDAESVRSVEASAGTTARAEEPSPNTTDSNERESGSTADSGQSATNATSATPSGSGEQARPPQGYAKAIRLLRNREFPMERAAVETLIAGAYDLESHETEKIVDHALEDDEFVERDGALHRS
ncbi:hypothetical protein AB7C87_14270 [Natrarchaeobius sp. A-rgal3]|uniref:hypothetical protein n=1 Tax=Natrarchaeobius versutus TaxID=1679078 RepID=UPI00350F676A